MPTELDKEERHIRTHIERDSPNEIHENEAIERVKVSKKAKEKIERERSRTKQILTL